ncbi:PTS sugar transporter subunit IIA, partial [Oceanivirga salmonicida]|uniref:PTS sugar transporter subunit IIA n=1 Tax=Oceanivirga salmonicida TaxID=1769291 RepID=UPI0012E39006
LINKLNKRYKINNIVIVSKIDMFKINIKDYDLLISTVDCNDLKINIKTLKISPLITNNEIQKLDKYFKIKTDIKLGQKTINSKSKEIFNDKNIFYIVKKINSWQEAIKIGVEKMSHLKFVDKNYYNKLINSVLEYGPYIVISKGIAIPHAVSENKKYKSGYVVVYFKHPIIFPNNKEVKLMFFIYNKNKNDNRDLIENIIKITEKNNIDFIKDRKTLKKYLLEETNNVDR